MVELKVEKASEIEGVVKSPPSKSYTHRALLLACLAHGQSRLRDPLYSADTMATLKAFDIVRTMTGGNFGTSVVANEFYTQSFRQGEEGKGLGAALAVILFVIIIPVIAYNVRQMRLVEETR